MSGVVADSPTKTISIFFLRSDRWRGLLGRWQPIFLKVRNDMLVGKLIGVIPKEGVPQAWAKDLDEFDLIKISCASAQPSKEEVDAAIRCGDESHATRTPFPFLDLTS